MTRAAFHRPTPARRRFLVPEAARPALGWAVVAVVAVGVTGGCGYDKGPLDPLEMLPRSEADVEAWNRWRRASDEVPDLRKADLRGYAFPATDFSDVDLREADLRGAKLANGIFDGAHLKGALLEGGDFSGATFAGADLRWVDFQQVEVRDADFQGADMRAADFTSVDMTGTDLGRADLRGSLLHGANLREADLEDTDLRGAIADTQTKWPLQFRYYRAQVRVERAARSQPSSRRGKSTPARTRPGALRDEPPPNPKPGQ